MAVLCALSSSFAMTASAKTEKGVVHTIAVNNTKNASFKSLDVKMKREGTMYDFFDNNGLTFTYGSSVSKNKSYGLKQGTSRKVKTKIAKFTLDKQPAPRTVNYGDDVKKGTYDLIYKHVSGGGFTDKRVITYKRY